MKEPNPHACKARSMPFPVSGPIANTEPALPLAPPIEHDPDPQPAALPEREAEPDQALPPIDTTPAAPRGKRQENRNG